MSLYTFPSSLFNYLIIVAQASLFNFTERKVMNNEHFLNKQELDAKDYTKVYGGGGFLIDEFDQYTILPVGPLKPKKPKIEATI
jgi:hypothetical protein